MNGIVSTTTVYQGLRAGAGSPRLPRPASPVDFQPPVSDIGAVLLVVNEYTSDELPLL